MGFFLKYKERILFCLVFAVIAAVNLYVYYHALYHVARSDHIIYLANTAKQTDWFSLAFSHSSYDRVIHYFWGWDARLFRPVYFFILGTQRFLFGYDFFWWQLSSILLHLFVQWNLLKLLSRFSSLVFAGILTLWFSTMLCGVEMVGWHHLGPYLFYVGLIVMALDRVWRVLDQGKITQRDLNVITGILFVACFTYEIGFIITGFIFLFLLLLRLSFKKQGKEVIAWKNMFLVIVPSVIYLSIYFLDLFLRKINFVQASSTFEAFNLIETIKSLFYTIWWVIYVGCFAPLIETKMYQRTIFRVDGFKPLANFMALTPLLKSYVIALFTLWGAGIWMFIRGFNKNKISKRLYFILLLSGIAFIQLFIIIFGRANLDGLEKALVHVDEEAT